MRAIMVWPDKKCHSNFNVQPMDYFWVECTVEEAEAKIVPMLSEEFLLRYQSISKEPNTPPPELSFMRGKRFFLVSRDGRDIEPFAWYFPFAGLWGAYCPFRCMRKRKVRDISDLRDIVVEIIDSVEWENSEAI
jgi:hypothetical protein